MIDLILGFYHLFDLLGDGSKWYHNVFAVGIVCGIFPPMIPICYYLTKK